jgi:hypothetical protein
LFRNGLDAAELGHGWVGGKSCHAGEFVGNTVNAAEESKGGIGGDERVEVRGVMRQSIGRNLAEAETLKEVR